MRLIRDRLLTLPDHTVVHTGRGDSTTIGAEREGALAHATPSVSYPARSSGQTHRMTAPATPTVDQTLAKVLLRRTVIAVLATAMLLVPAIVLFVITKQPSATYAAMGALAGIFAVMPGGTRIGFITAIVLALLAPLSIVAGLTPFTGAALMAIMALTVGRLARFGLHRATLLVPILLA